jgi:hypothetical protein
MTVICPDGHQSATTDYCDVCGLPIDRAPPPAPPPTTVLEAVEEADTATAARHEPCPRCSTARAGGDRYCENCGYDFSGPAPVAGTWEAVVTADRAQFVRFAVSGLSFPEDACELSFPLLGDRVRIGRSRGGPADQRPEIDLAREPEDPGISRDHAVLERQDDGSYAVRDLGSTNGTLINDDPTPVTRECAVPLASGDRIRLGAWTTIVIRSREASAGPS